MKLFVFEPQKLQGYSLALQFPVHPFHVGFGTGNSTGFPVSLDEGLYCRLIEVRRQGPGGVSDPDGYRLVCEYLTEVREDNQACGPTGVCMDVLTGVVYHRSLQHPIQYQGRRYDGSYGWTSDVPWYDATVVHEAMHVYLYCNGLEHKGGRREGLRGEAEKDVDKAGNTGERAERIS